MFVVIGTTTADVVVRSRSLASAGADGFRSGNVTFAAAPPRLLLGGNGGIGAYVLAGLGAPTALCSAVGDDLFGRTLLQWMRERGVNVDGVTRSRTLATSTSVILATDAATQSVVHHLGASAEVRLDSLPEGRLAEAEMLLASSFPLVPAMRGVGFARALSGAAAAGTVTALDVGPAIGAPATLPDIEPLLPSIHYLFGNTHELGVLVGTDDWEAAARRLVDAGARNVIVKRGRDGASLRGRDSRADAAGLGVTANISVGAGDAFDAGFLCAVHRGVSPERALRLGNAVAALVVAAERGIFDAPTWNQVEAFVASKGEDVS